MKIKLFLFFFSAILLASFISLQEKPVLYIIGDSTVKNGSGKGGDGLWGWGSFIGTFFDSTKIDVQNHAIGGRSSRTFITEGRWDNILKTLKKGDYVIMQFGHNDSSPLDDSARARGTIKGIGKEYKDTYNPIRKINERVYSYGHYMRQYVNDVKAKGAEVIICSPIPRENFKEGKVVRGNNDYGLWAKQIAGETNVQFIDLNNLIADQYDKMGAELVKKFFPKDHTHPNFEGSQLNAKLVIKGIKELKGSGLKNFLE